MEIDNPLLELRRTPKDPCDKFQLSPKEKETQICIGLFKLLVSYHGSQSESY